MTKLFVYVCASCAVARMVAKPFELETLPCSIMYGPQAQCPGTVKLVGTVMVGGVT